jgi:hypothetical protein
VVLIQIIMIYAFRVLEGIVYKITEDFDGTNELLSDAINFFFYFFFCFSDFFNTFPAVEMVFGNGQKLSLSPENYLFRVSS